MDKKAAIVLDNILTRRSVREFIKKEIEKEGLELILKAGDFAPSAGNLKSREFVCLKKKEDIEFILEQTFSKSVNGSKAMFANASCMMLLFADLSKSLAQYQRGELFAIEDATLAGQNMMLMAHALGIGSCWIGQFKEKEIIDRFKKGNGLKLIGIIAFGYPVK